MYGYDNTIGAVGGFTDGSMLDKQTSLSGPESDTDLGHTSYHDEEDKIESTPCILCGRPSPPDNQTCVHGCYPVKLSLRYDKKHTPTPERYECEQCGRIFKGRKSQERRFCSRDCQYERLSGENHPHWRGGREDYYGQEWAEQRRKALERDDGNCRSCGMSMEEHRSIHGCELHVHHITPFREFEDSEDANTLDNLITLCHTCHAKHEGDSKEAIINDGS